MPHPGSKFEYKTPARALTSILDTGASQPLYALLKDKVEVSFFALEGKEVEQEWIKRLLDNFDRYMSRVIQLTHFGAWDRETVIRSEYREAYPGSAKESRELPLHVIMARLLTYPELMRQVFHLRDHARDGCGGLDLDLFVIPPNTFQERPIWHLSTLKQIANYNDLRSECRHLHRDLKHFWISFVDGQTTDKPVPYKLMLDKTVWQRLARNQIAANDLDFSADFEIGSAYDDPVPFQKLHEAIQEDWSKDGAAIMKQAYIEYSRDLQVAIEKSPSLPLNPTDTYIRSSAERYNVISRLVRNVYAYNKPQNKEMPADIAMYVDKYWFKVDSVRANWTDELRGGVPGTGDNRVRFLPAKFEWGKTQQLEEGKNQIEQFLPAPGTNIEDQAIVNSWVKALEEIVARSEGYDNSNIQSAMVHIAALDAPPQNLVSFSERVLDVQTQATVILSDLNKSMRDSLARTLVPEDGLQQIQLQKFLKLDEPLLERTEAQERVAKLVRRAENAGPVNVALTGIAPIQTKVALVQDMYDRLRKIVEDTLEMDEKKKANVRKIEEPRSYLGKQKGIVSKYIVSAQNLGQSETLRTRAARNIATLSVLVKGAQNDEDLEKAYKQKEDTYNDVAAELELSIETFFRDFKTLMKSFEKEMQDEKTDFNVRNLDELNKAIGRAEKYLKDNEIIQEPLVFGQDARRSTIINRLEGAKQVLDILAQPANFQNPAFINHVTGYKAQLQTMISLAKDSIPNDGEIQSELFVKDVWNANQFNYSKKYFGLFFELVLQNSDLINDFFDNLKPRVEAIRRASAEYQEQVKQDELAEQRVEQQRREKAAAKQLEDERKAKEAAAEQARREEEAQQQQEALNNAPKQMMGGLPVVPFTEPTVAAITELRNRLQNVGTAELRQRLALDTPIPQALVDSESRRAGLLHAYWGAQQDPVNEQAIVRGLQMAQLNYYEEDDSDLFSAEEDSAFEQRPSQEELDRRAAEEQARRDAEKKQRDVEEAERQRIAREEEKAQVAEEARKLAEQEEAKRRAREEAEEEARRQAEEEEERKRREEEAERQRTEAERRRLAEEEEQRQRLEQEQRERENQFAPEERTALPLNVTMMDTSSATPTVSEFESMMTEQGITGQDTRAIFSDPIRRDAILAENTARRASDDPDSAIRVQSAARTQYRIQPVEFDDDSDLFSAEESS